jgi:serine/threonine-protein kinase
VHPERWKRVKDALSLALKRPTAERAAALDADAACRDNPSLRREVEDLLDCQAQMSGSFLEAPLVDGVPEAEGADDAEAPPSDLQHWTQYRIEEELGRGGMAVVYKAWDPRLRRSVAINLISGRDDLTVKRFLREAEAQAGVEHDNVLKIFETGVVGHHHYIAMQYVNGPTLLGVREDTTLDQKVELMLKVADGLHAAHRHGLVHRDIKPSNILVEESAEGLKPYVLDFGLAVELGAPALTKTGVVVGTPRYMAPERIHGGAAVLDRRSDIYSLGATFYEFISGTAPFASSSGLQVLVDVLEGDFTPLRALQPTIAPEIEAIIAKCLEKDPLQRYPSARALADDLRRYLDGDPVLARPMGRLRRLAGRARKHPRLTAAFATMTVLMLALAAWSGYGYWRTTRQTELAQRLGEEIRDVEWLFRAAEMSPLHAIGPQKQLVRQRMARLEQIMGEAGSLAFGPGHYALGRSSLTLGEHAKALQHLELAWNSGYHTADSATALGLAHGEIFRVELVKAQRIDGDRERGARIRTLEAAHRDPALRYLEEGRSSSIVPPHYVEALMASHRGDLPRAIERADAAARETPWLFEARLLPGHLEFKEAVRLYEGGDVEHAGEKAIAADRYYAEAERIAPSSIDAYQGRCAVAGLVLHMVGHRLSVDPATPLQRAETACAEALVVEPDGAEGHRLYAEAIQEWATLTVQKEADPGDAYDRAARLAERAMELSGGDVEARLALADIFVNRGWWESRTDRDPRASIDRAVALHAQVLAIDPRNVLALDNMGQAHVIQGRFERTHRLDASAAQNRAVSDFEQALRVDPSFASEYTNLGRAAVARADELGRHGLDPTSGLNDVLRFIEQLPGDRALPTRVDALSRLRARLAPAIPH